MDTLEMIRTEEKTYSLSGGAFYRENPNNLLAEPYEASGRFGPVTKYRAKGGKSIVDVLKDIDVPEYVSEGVFNISAGKSVISTKTDGALSQDENLNIAKTLSDTQPEIIKSKAKLNKMIMAWDEPQEEDIQTFDEVVSKYNPQLSIEEIKVFLWYMHSIDNTYKNEWLKIFNPVILKDNEEAMLINSWARQGLIAYYEGRWYPNTIYLSGNLYEKKAAFETEKQGIADAYGFDIAQKQEELLNQSFDKIYQSRLKLDDPIVEKRLRIKPFSDFAKNITIGNWVIDSKEEKPAEFIVPTSKSEKNYGDLSWYLKKTHVSQWDRNSKKVSELSLADAFRYWLKFGDVGKIPNNFTWEDIFSYYLDKKSKKNMDPTVLSRNRALAKDAGEKLFSKFLAEVISENDRVKIEYEWNKTYNANLPIDYDKIPIGFSCAKNYPGDNKLEMRPEKREAIAFHVIAGSSLNAYGVGYGKANLLSSDILTPNGWVKMGNIKPGMYVIGRDGNPTKVKQVFPQGKMEAYRVTMSDGSFTDVTGDHLWHVSTIHDRNDGSKNNFRILQTKEMMGKLRNYRNNRQFSIPMVSPVQLNERKLLIDPYLMGALLGDGGLTKGVSFSNPEIEIQDKIKLIVNSYGLLLSPTKSRPKKDFDITKGNNGRKINSVLDAIKKYGLYGKKSDEKFIPNDYLYNTAENRLRILQGIMDRDGYTNKNGQQTQITTTSLLLAINIKELVQSFGGTVSQSIKNPKYTYKGEKKNGKKAYVLTVRLPADIAPFTTQKHLRKYQPKTKYQPIRFIESIEPRGKYEAQCISVEAEDHLYVCDQYIVTHNTWAAIFNIAQALDAGLCSRPFIVVPNQVYKQFYSEIKGLLPNRRINDFYNLSKDYLNQFKDENGETMMVESGSISIMTYQGFEQIGFNDETQSRMMGQLKDAVSMLMDVDISTKKGSKVAVREEGKLEGIIGKALSKSTVNIEDLGFDFVIFDEAHALKKVFTQVKARKGSEDEDKKGKKMYEIASGTPSTRGIKGYFICSYIQMLNKGRNVLLLTATPFTNSPLEVYSMLSLVAYQYMTTINLSNINDFFDNFCQMSYELIINSKLKPERKEVFKGFDNLIGLQKLIYSRMLYKEAGVPDAKGNIITISRPDKWVLPYKGRLIDGEYIAASHDEFVDTVLSLTDEQSVLMKDVISYVEGEISYETLSKNMSVTIDEEEDENLLVTIGEELSEYDMNDEEKAGVRTLRGVNFARSISLSPYLYEFYGKGSPNYKNYVESSPKLTYIMKCVKAVKNYHTSRNEPISGQVIYMDRGKKYFELLKDYLVREIGYKEHEIGIIRSGKEGTAQHKENVKNGFNGMAWDEPLKRFVDIPDEKRIKVVIGTGSIKEGMNLQRYSTVLYNAFIDWNPTDQMQLEGRVWRQGNIFKNVRIVIPLMADSMDIFMFQKLEEKTSRINSIWNYDGKTNVLPIEELDPQEQKMALITNPRVIAELEGERDMGKIDEIISVHEADIKTAENIISFIETRNGFISEMQKTMLLISPDKANSSIDVMVKTFESAFQTGKVGDRKVTELLRDVNIYNYRLIDYNKNLTKPYDYGRMKGSIAMIKKAKEGFLKRNNLGDDIKEIEFFIENHRKSIIQIGLEKERLTSDNYLNDRAREIEQERKEQRVRFLSVDERVDEFSKLNYLLEFKREEKIADAEKYILEDSEGCPPMTKDGLRDISPAAIKKLESCIANIPNTKDLHLVDGEYTPERLKLHKMIKAKMRERAECVVSGREPIAILMGGVPGSGKTYFLKKYAPFLTKEKIFKVDADEIRAQLPEYKGWNSKATHLETQDIYLGLLDDISKGEPCKYDILWDGTMNRANNYFPLIGAIRKLGYKIFIIYIKVPMKVSIERALKRYQNPEGDGRYVPMDVLKQSNKRGTIGFEELKPKVDGYLLIDGMSGDIIEKGGEQIIDNRGYFDKEATGNEMKVKKAKLKAKAQQQRIRILELEN
jgi:hypothetical protein